MNNAFDVVYMFYVAYTFCGFFFETFLFILDYNLRPRSVLPPGPVKNLYSVYMGIPLHSVFNIL